MHNRSPSFESSSHYSYAANHWIQSKCACSSPNPGAHRGYVSLYYSARFKVVQHDLFSVCLDESSRLCRDWCHDCTPRDTACAVQGSWRCTFRHSTKDGNTVCEFRVVQRLACRSRNRENRRRKYLLRYVLPMARRGDMMPILVSLPSWPRCRCHRGSLGCESHGSREDPSAGTDALSGRPVGNTAIS